MKQLFKMTMALLALLLTIGGLQAQSVITNGQSRGDGLANPEINSDTYDAYKVQWVQENPDEYNQLLQGTRVKSDNGSHREAIWGAPENKAQWAAEHPREYAEYMESLKKTETAPAPTMTRSEFNALPQGRQQAILNETNTRIIDDNTK
jgi:hypothetical protein